MQETVCSDTSVDGMHALDAMLRLHVRNAERVAEQFWSPLGSTLFSLYSMHDTPVHMHWHLQSAKAWVAAGISLAEELDVDSLLSEIPADQKQQRQQKLTETAWQAAVEEFKLLSDAIHDDNVRASSSIHSHPWRD